MISQWYSTVSPHLSPGRIFFFNFLSELVDSSIASIRAWVSGVLLVDDAFVVKNSLSLSLSTSKRLSGRNGVWMSLSPVQFYVETSTSMWSEPSVEQSKPSIALICKSFFFFFCLLAPKSAWLSFFCFLKWKKKVQVTDFFLTIDIRACVSAIQIKKNKNKKKKNQSTRKSFRLTPNPRKSKNLEKDKKSCCMVRWGVKIQLTFWSCGFLLRAIRLNDVENCEYYRRDLFKVCMLRWLVHAHRWCLIWCSCGSEHDFVSSSWTRLSSTERTSRSRLQNDSSQLLCDHARIRLVQKRGKWRRQTCLL